MGAEVSGSLARAPGRDGMSDTGLYEFNRMDMTVATMEARARAGDWVEGDLFAIFRDDLGGTHAQHSTYQDFFEVAITQLVRARRHIVGLNVDREMAHYLVGILMISRIHPYHFENFLELRDHNLKQIFDMRGLCAWIARNEELFMTEAEAAVENALADGDIEALREGDPHDARLLMGATS